MKVERAPLWATSCQKALSICEAAAKYPDDEDKPEEWRIAQDAKRIKAANQAAAKWDREHNNEFQID